MRRGSLKGFAGSITRVVNIKGTKEEFFIKGHENSTFEEAIRQSWPYENNDLKKKWKVVASSGEDLTKRKISSYDETVILEFLS
ncbi:MAG: hypothetical protein ACFFED_11845 [Candidatus Thorarchaeota archaeon]